MNCSIPTEAYSTVAPFTRKFKAKQHQNSMTEENHCYENAIAERANGILKDEFYLDQTFDSSAQAKAQQKCNQIIQPNKITLIFRF